MCIYDITEVISKVAQICHTQGVEKGHDLVIDILNSQVCGIVSTAWIVLSEIF